jgi:hypothetical protein
MRLDVRIPLTMFLVPLIAEFTCPSDALAGSASARAAGVDYCYQAYSVKPVGGSAGLMAWRNSTPALVGRIAQENV